MIGICGWCEREIEIAQTIDGVNWCQTCLDLVNGSWNSPDIHAPVDDPYVDGLEIEVWETKFNERQTELALALLACIVGCVLSIIGAFFIHSHALSGIFMMFMGAAVATAGALAWGHTRKD